MVTLFKGNRAFALFLDFLVQIMKSLQCKALHPELS